MSYDEYVNNVGNMFEKFLDKQEKGEEISDADRAALVGLFKRGFKDSWVDDAIIGVMGNSETRQKIGRKLGWKNADFTPERIGQVEMLFASGGNVKFAERNAVFRELTDAVQFGDVKELNMDMAGLFDGIRSGSFKKKDGSLASDGELNQLRQAVHDQAKKLGVEFNKQQQDLLEKIRNRAVGEVAGAAANDLEEYLDVMRQNQSAMQFFGNIRNEAIEKRHGENAGWALQHDVGGGERMYIASGQRAAMAHVFGDVNKTDVRVRVPAHSHMMFNLGVESGAQVAFEVRRDHYSKMRNGVVDQRSWSGTPPRQVQLAMGVAAGDTMGQFIDKRNGSFKVGASERAQKEWQSKHKWQYENAMKGKSKEQQKKIIEAITAQHIVRNLYVPMFQEQATDFLLTTAAASGVQPNQAVSSGKMNLSIPRVLPNGEVETVMINNVSQFIDHVRKGTFGFTEDVAPYNPVQTNDDGMLRAA